MQFKPHELEATRLRKVWAVRPKGQLGTIGWYPRPWEVVYVSARTEQEATEKASRMQRR